MLRQIPVPLSVSELIDKITILEIKQERVTNEDKLANIRRELRILRDCRDAAVVPSTDLDALTVELRAINEKMWGFEDQIRDCEQRSEFGAPFVAVARAMYQTNDKRADVKRAINVLFDSEIVEEKSYPNY